MTGAAKDQRLIQALKINAEHSLHGFFSGEENGKIHIRVGHVPRGYPVAKTRETLSLRTLRAVPKGNSQELQLELSEFKRIADLINHTTKVLQGEIVLGTQLSPAYRKGQAYSFHLSEADFVRRAGAEIQIEDFPPACLCAENWRTPRGKGFYQQLLQVAEPQSRSEEQIWADNFLRSRGLHNEALLPREGEQFRLKNKRKAANAAKSKKANFANKQPSLRNLGAEAEEFQLPEDFDSSEEFELPEDFADIDNSGNFSPPSLLSRGEHDGRGESGEHLLVSLLKGVWSITSLLAAKLKSSWPYVKQGASFAGGVASKVFSSAKKGVSSAAKALVGAICRGISACMSPFFSSCPAKEELEAMHRSTRRMVMRRTPDWIPCQARSSPPITRTSQASQASQRETVNDRAAIAEKARKREPLTSSHPHAEEAECIVCLSEKATAVFLPCAHMVACGECMEQMQSMGMDKKCPVCRTETTEIRMP